jgi:hypothetical protein
MKASHNIIEIADLPPSFFSTLEVCSPSNLRFGVFAIYLADLNPNQFRTALETAIYVEQLIANGLEIRVYLDVIGRLAGLVAFVRHSESRVDVQAFLSLHGSAMSIALMTIHRLERSISQISWMNRRIPGQIIMRKVIKPQNSMSTSSFLSYWTKDLGRECKSTAKELTRQLSAFGFALRLAKARKSYPNLTVGQFYKLITHPVMLRQVNILYGQDGQPNGLEAWASLHRESSQEATQLEPYIEDLSSWRRGEVCHPIWKI